jgi:hypothetical protein
MNIENDKLKMLEAIALIQQVNSKLDELYFAHIAKLDADTKKAA